MQRGTKKAEATKLRLKGYSYKEIWDKLGVPKSTLSSWFKDLVLSQKAQDRLKVRHGIGTEALIKRNKMQTHIARQQATKIQNEASGEIGKLTNRDLMLIGTALYWGEGYKKLIVRDGKKRTWHKISFSNTDPKMIYVFVKFMTDVLHVQIDSIKVRMRLYEHINEKEALDFWSKSIGLPKGNFQKTSYAVSISSKRKLPYNRLPHGTLCVEISDTKKFHRILGMIEGLKNTC
ncbi:hypothetical protein COU13_00525 [Candidatus Kaiserbacteria bacterium CG10_big_fil_rev_8_21_14_0_10_43_70]|uniref:Uncharacterized protein n=1 Tax=Candidatus Kaiserbacteria bacterium CG10_big_fil_rev_8_21_14_0_10_43_70 TaxID=1974605 RepID=A0A2H0UJD5_9BACT|nr:MAG: hypothetical protein COU13_00525 [Candidatus Kaiserbacteria bacterium CG10_big_fil_rev_8_21_14_0_10_43_70]